MDYQLTEYMPIKKLWEYMEPFHPNHIDEYEVKRVKDTYAIFTSGDLMVR